MYTTKKEITDWLNKMEIVDYTINDDLTVDILGNIHFSYKEVPKIPIQFGTIYGSFSIYNCGLMSLKGCPEIVKGNFNIGKNDLKSFEHCPEIVEGDFIGGDNKITNFNHMPKKVNGDIEVLNNPIKNLRNSMEFVGGKISVECLVGFEQFIIEKYNLIELSLLDINRYYEAVDLNKKLDKELPNKKFSKKVKI